ncbi:MAG: hypothetical protein AAFP02_23560, partial [Bacteroidota bacterium]
MLVTACNKDSIEELTPSTTESTNAPSLYFQAGGGGDDEATETDCDALCFDFTYPVTLEMPDGSTQTANSDEELEAIFETWFEENGEDAETEPELIFPIDVILLESGDTETLTSEEDLIELIDD